MYVSLRYLSGQRQAIPCFRIQHFLLDIQYSNPGTLWIGRTYPSIRVIYPVAGFVLILEEEVVWFRVYAGIDLIQGRPGFAHRPKSAKLRADDAAAL